MKNKLTRCNANEPCAMKKALNIIGSKWTFLIIRDLLLDGPTRYGSFLKSLEGISPKTLSLRLKELEKHKIINRTVYPEIPPRVEYSLTEQGLALEKIFIELDKWGKTL